MERWPNFFIVGAPKSGTTTLFAYLKTVPEIFMPEIKEPNYFSVKNIPDDHPTIPIRDKKNYLELFKGVKDEKIIGEASPTYLADPDASKLIHEVSPDAKILISLRDPVERAYSYYLHSKRLGNANFSFQEMLQNISKEEDDIYKNSLGLSGGLYFKNVKRYIDVFGRKQVKILIFEEWTKDVKKTLQDVLEFLSIDYVFKEFKDEIYNEYGVPRGPIASAIIKNMKLKRFAKTKVPSSIRKFLKQKIIMKSNTKPIMGKEETKFLVDFYQQDVQNLQELLGKKFPWKNFMN